MKTPKDLLNEAKSQGIDRIVVGALVYRNDSGRQILALERSRSDFMGGIEEFPSGQVDDGESLTTALERELIEETALQLQEIVIYAFSFDYLSKSGKRTRQLNFEVKVVPGSDVHLNPAEHSSYRWLDSEQYTSSRLTPNVVKLLQDYELENNSNP